MTNEIKEDDTSYLIDCLKSHKINFDYCLNELLDYITNLQEENKRLKDYLKIMEKSKDNNLHRFLDYKQRIDKAVEYLEAHTFNEYTHVSKTEYAIKILRGDE